MRQRGEWRMAGRSARWRAGVAVGLMVLAGAAVCSSALSAKAPGSERVPAAVTTAREDFFARYYAPLLLFDSGEAYFPMSVESFISNSRLEWRHWQGACGPGVTNIGKVLVARGAIEPERLGTVVKLAKYRHEVLDRETCEYTGPTFKTTALTRPYEEAKRSKRLQLDEGFVLNLGNDRRKTRRDDVDKVPLYYETGVNNAGQRWIRYYVMYGWSGPPAGGKASGFCCHEGEWEGISLVFWGSTLDPTKARPAWAYYNAHYAGTKVQWHNVIRATDKGKIWPYSEKANVHLGTHPIVFVANKAHASYPLPGGNGIGGVSDDTSGNGLKWRTWLSPTVNVKTQPWYGFGGAWGDHCVAPKKGPLVPGCPDRTGPLGPGPKATNTTKGFPSPFIQGPLYRFPDKGAGNTTLRVCAPGFAATSLMADKYENQDYGSLCFRPRYLPAFEASGRRSYDITCDDLLRDTYPPYRKFPVGRADPYGFDGAPRDGIGCEKEKEPEKRSKTTFTSYNFDIRVEPTYPVTQVSFDRFCYRLVNARHAAGRVVVCRDYPIDDGPCKVSGNVIKICDIKWEWKQGSRELPVIEIVSLRITQMNWFSGGYKQCVKPRAVLPSRTTTVGFMAGVVKTECLDKS